MLQKYLNDLYETAKGRDATEPSFYPDLKAFLHTYLLNKKINPSITVEAKKKATEKPDFTIRKGYELIGYIEAKDPKYENLDNLPERDIEQLKRYKERLPNLILTNFLDFRLYRENKLIREVRIGMPRVLNELKAPPPPQNEEDLIEILNLFFAYYIPEKRTPKALAEELAKRAQLLPHSIIGELNNEKETQIDRIYNAFKEYLMSDLTKEEFADIYAQTLTYGLFMARLNYPHKNFNRKKAGDYIPKSIRILKDTFNLISSDAIPESLESYVDDIATILAHSDTESIKGLLEAQTGKSDPLIHFYQTFLEEYDPAKRKALGVYYTPLPVVSYITRSVNKLLKEKFKISDGLANESITILDPAAGTLTFPAEAAKIAVKEQKRYSESVSSLKKHLLNHFYAFEILMAPYIIGHLRMSLLLHELKIPLKENERFPLYLTNSLDFSEIHHSNLPFVADLAKEAEDAKKVKDENILVILGNPPYSSEKKERGTLPPWISEKLKDYSTGLEVEKERKKGVLQDDYIRFIRLGHWKIDKYGKGIMAYITNNSFLDGIIHRSMRAQLINSFDEIYILNLHGNSRIGEKTPKGTEDENVFDIQQGVTIAFFVKTGSNDKTKIYYKDLWGKREEKYAYLNENILDTKNFELLNPQPDKYFLVKKDYSLESKWDSWLGINQIFANFMSGVETKRDDLVVDFDKLILQNRISKFSNSVGDVDFIRESFNLSKKSDLNIGKAKQELQNMNIGEKIIPYYYRPFDIRYLFYDKSLVSRTRGKLMESLDKHRELSIVTVRQIRSREWKHILIGEGVIDATYLANITSEWSYVFPINSSQIDTGQESLFSKNLSSSNFSNKFWNWFDQNSLGSTVPQWDIFYYIYAILHSNIYRNKYLEFLRSDFPHIPFTKDDKLFFQLSKLGNKLADLHLLKDTYNYDVKLHGDNDNVLKKRYWDKDKIFINDTQYFAPVSEEVWNYYIGGYQVADKWLKDRLNKELSREEIKQYCRIIPTISETIRIQKEIDKLYPRVENYLTS